MRVAFALATFKRSGRSPLPPKEDDELARLCNRVGRTYHAHLAMAKRLQRRERNWNAALITLSCVSTVAAVALLSAPGLYGERGSTLWALIGVVTLAVSLVVANADYRVRAISAFSHYRRLQRLWADLDFINLSTASVRRRRAGLKVGDERYQAILDEIPNHSSADFFSVMRLHHKGSSVYSAEQWSHLSVTFGQRLAIYGSRSASMAMTAAPLVIAGASLIALVPVIGWALGVN